MGTEFITPIKVIDTIGGLQQNQGVKESGRDGGSVFADIFKNAVNDVENTQEILGQEQYLLSTGQTESAHTVQIAAAEAQIAVDMLVQLRNKAMDSYNELMRISL